MRERDLKRRSQTEARQSPQRLRVHRVLAFFASGKDNPYRSTVARAGANLKAVMPPCIAGLRRRDYRRVAVGTLTSRALPLALIEL